MAKGKFPTFSSILQWYVQKNLQQLTGKGKKKEREKWKFPRAPVVRFNVFSIFSARIWYCKFLST